MKVCDLKKELEKYPDNMDVKLWNGMVEDWMNIKLGVTEVVMETTEWDKLVSPKERRRRKEWEFPNEFIDYDDPKQKKFYRFKKIVLIGAKRRGKVSLGFDRAGDVEY